MDLLLWNSKTILFWLWFIHETVMLKWNSFSLFHHSTFPTLKVEKYWPKNLKNFYSQINRFVIANWQFKNGVNQSIYTVMENIFFGDDTFSVLEKTTETLYDSRTLILFYLFILVEKCILLFNIFVVVVQSILLFFSNFIHRMSEKYHFT